MSATPSPIEGNQKTLDTLTASSDDACRVPVTEPNSCSGIKLFVHGKVSHSEPWSLWKQVSES